MEMEMNEKQNEVELVEKTISEIMKSNAICIPDRTAFIFDDVRYSWKEMENITDFAAGKMQQLGIKKGTHIGFWSLNHIRLIILVLAAMKIGAVSVIINYSYKALELKNVLCKSDVEILFIGESNKNMDFMHIAGKVLADCPKLAEIIDMQKIIPCVKISNIVISEDVHVNLEKAKNMVSCFDVSCITFTSGTTAVPKPVMLSQYNMINNAIHFAHRMKVSCENRDVVFAPLPMFHSSGMTGMLIFAVSCGITAVVHRKFIAEKALEDIDKYNITTLMLVPSMIEMLAANQNKKHSTESIRVCQTSGAVISTEHLQIAVRMLGIKHFLMGYGQTECSPLITLTQYDDDLKTVSVTAGMPLEHVKIRIWDLNQNKKNDPWMTGEIQVKGFNVMIGYYNCPEENKKKFTSDGWLKTQDAGFLDDNGYLHFVTRLSDIIIRHGENISPGEIETVVKKYNEKILKVKVVGVQEKIVQEEIVCFIQAEDVVIEQEKIREYVKSILASYKVPKYVFQIDQFPLTETGKIDQNAVKVMAQDYVNMVKNNWSDKGENNECFSMCKTSPRHNRNKN